MYIRSGLVPLCLQGGHDQRRLNAHSVPSAWGCVFILSVVSIASVIHFSTCIYMFYIG